MIDKVLILGIRRAKELISDFEIAQMVGRCGRSYTESGEATLIVPSSDEEIAERYLFSKPKPIRSSFSKIDDAAFHFLPEIKSNDCIATEELFDLWFSRSFAHMQGLNLNWNDLIEHLIENECILRFNGKLVLSDLGKVSCNFYLSPDQVFQMKTKMEKVYDVSQFDAIFISWVLAYERIYKNLEEDQFFQEYLSDVNGRRFFFEDQEGVDGYAWFCVFSGKNSKIVKNEILNRRKDVSRMIGALIAISSILDLKLDDKLNSYEICASKGIPIEFAEIANNFPDAKKSIVFELDSFSIHTPEELVEKFDQVEHYGSNGLREYVKCKSIKIE